MENEFGKNLKRIRKERNLTQKKLAKLTYLNRSVIGMYEANIRIPKYRNYLKLCKVLEVENINGYVNNSKKVLRQKIYELEHEVQKLEIKIKNCSMCKVRKELEEKGQKEIKC
jgi:transcriptional regulator with XRE-family HTH domain